MEAKKRGRPANPAWADMDARLGIDSDEVIAQAMGVGRTTVVMRRRKLGIASPAAQKWTAVDARLGVDPDVDIARDCGISRNAVWSRRRRLGIASPPRRSTSGGRIKTERIQVMCTRAERETIEQAAIAAGLTVSAYVVRAAMGGGR